MDDETRARHALAIYTAAVKAADPRALVRRAVSGLDAQRVTIAAVGKASIAMAEGALDALGERVVASVVVTNEERLAAGLRVVRGDHPVPGAASFAAGDALLALARSCGESDCFLALVSGGASALAEVPRAGLTPDGVARTHALLLASGAPIAELNVVRKHLSALKGGRLARAARPGRVVTLALSDVIGGTLGDVGSGPTVPDPTTSVDARVILARHGLLAAVPRAVRALLDEPESAIDPAAFAGDEATILGDACIAAEAAASAATALGYRARVVTTTLVGEARDAAADVVRSAQAESGREPVCLVFAGETTVAVRGSGRGGRAQTLALAAALALERDVGITIAALATDGVDGPTDAAGAIIDGRTAGRSRGAGVDPTAALANDDAYPALDAAGALVRTGPSGTNVNDLVLALVTR